MKKFNINKSSLVTALMFVGAACLMLAGTVGGTRSALTYFSETYDAHVEMYDIGVTLMEQCENDDAPHAVSYRNYIPNSNGQWSLDSTALVEHMLEEGETLQIGKTYNEALSVYNSGTINEYVRVKVYKYWVDTDGNKVTTLSPDLIDLHFTNIGSGWILGSQTKECTELYYSSLLVSGASTVPFTDTLTIYVDDTILGEVTQTQVGNVIYYTYEYNGYRFCIEAEVDAIQEHNADDAAMSVWGVELDGSGSR